jgi:uncharacterized protein (DUF2267 family)
MDYEHFVRAVARAGSMRNEEAERAASVTLELLGARLDERDARDLADELPPELGALLLTVWENPGPDPFGDPGAAEFLRRVAERESVGYDTAVRDARAVFAALAETVGLERLSQIVAALPVDFELLLPSGPRDEVERTRAFLKRVYRRAPLPDCDATRRATEVVLETLAERVDAGEVEDLIARLPIGLHVPLWRGLRESGDKAEQMTIDEFLARIADREGVSREAALDHARAVFATLREKVGDKEFSEVVAELPPEYSEALAV